MAHLEWWWEDHRIPRELEWIEQGLNINGEWLTTYIMGWLYYVIPNLRDLIEYYRFEGGEQVKMKETITIYLNGTPKNVEKREYTYLEVVELLGMTGYRQYTMVSTNKNGKNPKSYSSGDRIRMREGMRINVDLTSNG